MYKFYRDYLYGRWNVYFTHDGKEDYIQSFDTADEAFDYCNQKNCELVNAEYED
jgi:hypothetical protein